MSDEKIFVNGLIVKEKHPNAPDFVKMNLSIKCRDLLDFMKANSKDGWINVQIKESKGGKLYAELDTWEPQQQPAQEAAQPAGDFADFDDDIPFN